MVHNIFLKLELITGNACPQNDKIKFPSKWVLIIM